jgi:hypothetical protein
MTSPPRLQTEPTETGLVSGAPSVAFQATTDAPTLEVQLGPDPVAIASIPSPPDTVIVLPVQGPQGEAGESGEAATGYDHTQSSASASWIITHGLGYYPVVSVHVGDEQVIADVEYGSVNQVTITFASPQTGSARLI